MMRCDRYRYWLQTQSQPQALQLLTFPGAAQKSIMTDFHEALRKDVLREPAHKLPMRQTHTFGLALGFIILVAKGNPLLINPLQTMIADSDLVRVPAQILHHRLGTPKRPLGINDPVLATQLPHCRSKDISFIELGERARKAQATARVRRLETFKEQSPEQA